MPFGTTLIGYERAGLFRFLASGEDPSSLRVCKIKVTELADCFGMTPGLLGFSGIGTIRYATENAPGFFSSFIGCPRGPVPTNCVKALSVFRRSVENNVADGF
jgi:hypothetical protein